MRQPMSLFCVEWFCIKNNGCTIPLIYITCVKTFQENLYIHYISTEVSKSYHTFSFQKHGSWDHLISVHGHTKHIH